MMYRGVGTLALKEEDWKCITMSDERRSSIYKYIYQRWSINQSFHIEEKSEQSTLILAESGTG